MSQKSFCLKTSRSSVKSSVCSHTAEVLKVLTLSHQLQDTDVTGLSLSLCEYFQYMQSKSEQSKLIPLTSTLFHRSVSSSAVTVSRAVINTPSPCQIKAWNILWSKKKGVSFTICSFSWSIPCNYRDLCYPTFQREFVSQPPVEIWPVFSSSDFRRWEREQGKGLHLLLLLEFLLLKHRLQPQSPVRKLNTPNNTSRGSAAAVTSNTLLKVWLSCLG